MKLFVFLLLFPLVASAQTVKLGDIALTPGKATAFDAPLSPALQSEAAKGGNPTVAVAKCAIAVPVNFDPAKSWPVVVVSAADGSPNKALMNAFVGPATGKGWVVVAADAAEKPQSETTEWCYAMVASAFDLMEKAWPGARKWPIANGGFSGGAKRAAPMAAIMMANNYTVIGMFMGGCNEDRSTEAVNGFHPGGRYKNVPVYLCGGAQDPIATPTMRQHVKTSIQHNGFTNVRLESYEGGHVLSPPQVAMALDWFNEVASKSPSKSGSEPNGKSFDDFFKKK